MVVRIRRFYKQFQYITVRGLLASVVLIAMGCGPAAFAGYLGQERVRLEDLERHVSQAKDLKDFLSRKGLVERYRQLLIGYYGLSDYALSKTVFDVFIDQLQYLADHSQPFAKAIWQPRSDLGQLHSVNALAYRQQGAVDQAKLLGYFEDQIGKSHLLIQQNFPNYLRSGRFDEVIGVLRKTQERIDIFQRDTRKYGRRVVKAKSANFYRQLAEDPVIRSAVHIIAYKELLNIRWEDHPGSHQVMNTILQREKDDGARSRYPLAYRSLAGNILPSADQFVQQQIFWSRKSAWNYGVVGAGEYDFVPTPRVLHTMVKGTLHSECVGGDCTTRKRMSPLRWATAALKGAKFFFVEHEGQNRGWVQLMPVENIVEPRQYYNLESGTSVFNKDILEKDGFDLPQSFVSVWLQAFRKAHPKAPPIIISPSNAIKNSGSLPFIRDSLAHRLGVSIYDHGRFQVRDRDMQNQLVVLSEEGQLGRDPEELSHTRKGHMILDVFSNTEDRYKTFRVFNEPFQLQNLYSKSGLQSYYDRLSPDDRPEVLSQFIQYDIEDVEVNRLIDEWMDELDVEEWAFVYERLQKDFQYGILRRSRRIEQLLERMDDAPVSIFRITDQLPTSQINFSIFRFYDVLMAYGHREKLFAAILASLHSLEEEEVLMAHIMSQAKSVDDFMLAVNHLYTYESVNSFARSRIEGYLSRFFELNPTVNQTMNLRHLFSKSAEELSTLYVMAAKHFQSPVEIERLWEIVSRAEYLDTKQAQSVFQQMLQHHPYQSPTLYQALMPVIQSGEFSGLLQGLQKVDFYQRHHARCVGVFEPVDGRQGR